MFSKTFDRRSIGNKAHDNKIVFFTIYAKYDSLTHEAIAFAKVDEVGGLFLTDRDSIGESDEANMQIAEIRASFPKNNISIRWVLLILNHRLAA